MCPEKIRSALVNLIFSGISSEVGGLADACLGPVSPCAPIFSFCATVEIGKSRGRKTVRIWSISFGVYVVFPIFIQSWPMVKVSPADRAAVAILQYMPLRLQISTGSSAFRYILAYFSSLIRSYFLRRKLLRR